MRFLNFRTFQLEVEETASGFIEDTTSGGLIKFWRSQLDNEFMSSQSAKKQIPMCNPGLVHTNEGKVTQLFQSHTSESHCESFGVFSDSVLVPFQVLRASNFSLIFERDHVVTPQCDSDVFSILIWTGRILYRRPLIYSFEDSIAFRQTPNFTPNRIGFTASQRWNPPTTQTQTSLYFSCTRYTIHDGA